MSDFTPIETQEDFNKAIEKRLDRERNTIRKEYEGFLSPEDAQKKYEGYLSPEQVQERYKDYLSPEESAKKDATIKSYELKSKRVEIALSQGIPYELAGKISGETEEEMKKDAETFAGFIKSGNRYPNFNADPVNKESREDVALKEMLNDLKGD